MSARRGQPPPPAVQQTYYPWGHPLHGQAVIRLTDHDVISGRGVNIAQHAGNERFRALVNSRHDANYCHAYTTAEKRAVAEEIVAHIRALNPPGRFLRRSKRKFNRSSRGLEVPWEELTREEEIKKTCQALRDCNRQDRTGYAAAVAVPEDVHYSEHIRLQTGMTNKQQAELAAAQNKQEAALAARANLSESALSTALGKHAREEREAGVSGGEMEPTPIDETPSILNAAAWLKKQRLDGTPMPHATPATAGSSGGFSSLQDEDEDEDDRHPHLHHHDMLDDYSAAAATLLSTHLDHHNMPASPAVASNPHPFPDHDDDLRATFEEGDDAGADGHADDDDDDAKPPAIALLQHSSSIIDLVDPLHLAAEAAAAMGRIHHDHLDDNSREDFGPPSPLHTDHVGVDDDDLRDHSFQD